MLPPTLANSRRDYKDYLKQNFPGPQLEMDERGQLNDIRIDEAETLNSYDWVDQKAGTVRIPIDRAMDLIVQRGLPVRSQVARRGVRISTVEDQSGKKMKGTGK